MTTGLILFAHGARDPRWALPFEAVADRVRSLRPTADVRLAFLEFMAPGLVEAGAELAARGCRTIDIVPLFLGAGGHVRKDLPALVGSLQQSHPAVVFTLHAAIGEMDSVVQAMADAAVSAIGANEALPL